MGGEYDANVALALANLAETMRVQSEVTQEHLRMLQWNNAPQGEYHGLAKFLKRDPPSIASVEERKVTYVGYMLIGEAENWWT